MFSDVSNMTDKIDGVFLYIAGISLVMLVLITALMVYFAVRYRKARNPRAESVRGSLGLEITWAVVPTLIVVSMFFYGFKVYNFMSAIPADALTIKVTGRQWSWLFEYPNGRKNDELRVPVGRAVRLNIGSADVLHSFYIPAFRLKKDAVPGMETNLWFVANEAGSYDVFCSVFCGEGHSRMLSKVVAMPQADYDRWYAASGAPETEASPAERGARLVKENGCLGCHSTDGSVGVGPTFQGLFGRHVTVTTNGKERTLTADEEYVKRSIVDPGADVVKGFPDGVMPKDYSATISSDDLKAILSYLESLGAPTEAQGAHEEERAKPVEEKEKPQTPEGEKFLQKYACTACHSTNGSAGVGPTFQGLYGKKVTVTTNGKERTLTADGEYIERAILEPGADVVKGFPDGVMPRDYRAKIPQEDVKKILAYLETLATK